MTDLRKAAEMALEALEFAASEIYNEHNDDVIADAIKALRQALAQKQTKCPRCGEVNPAEIHTCSPQVAQPEREWVGLTEDEIIGHTCECVDDGTFNMDCAINFANSMQEALKRYNT